jgi:hypothetical protein
MALRGTTSIAQTSSTAVTSASMTYAGASNIVLGDLIILVSEISEGNGTPTFTDPSGFTPGASISIPDIFWAATGSDALHIAVKIAAVGDVGTPTYSTTSSQAGFWKQHIRVYSGRINSSVGAAFGNSSVTAASSSETYPITYPMTGITALAGDDIVVVIGAASPTGQSGITSYSTTITGYTNTLVAFSVAASNNNGVLSSLDNVNNAGGATGTLSASLTHVGDAGNTGQVQGFVISLPAAPQNTASIAWVS